MGLYERLAVRQNAINEVELPKRPNETLVCTPWGVIFGAAGGVASGSWEIGIASTVAGGVAGYLLDRRNTRINQEKRQGRSNLNAKLAIGFEKAIIRRHAQLTRLPKK